MLKMVQKVDMSGSIEISKKLTVLWAKVLIDMEMFILQRNII
jgi:hypothetical protein